MMQRVALSRMQAVWACAGYVIAAQGQRDFFAAVRELTKMEHEELEKLIQLVIDDIGDQYEVHIREQQNPAAQPMLRLVRKV